LDGKSRATDKFFIERFWRSVKYDYVYLKVLSDELGLYQVLKEYINYYNNRLCHQGIGRSCPAGLYKSVASRYLLGLTKIEDNNKKKVCKKFRFSGGPNSFLDSLID